MNTVLLLFMIYCATALAVPGIITMNYFYYCILLFACSEWENIEYENKEIVEDENKKIIEDESR